MFSRCFVDHTWPVISGYFARKITNKSASSTPKISLFWYRIKTRQVPACTFVEIPFGLFKKDSSVRIFHARKELNTTFFWRLTAVLSSTECFFFFKATHLLLVLIYSSSKWPWPCFQIYKHKGNGFSTLYILLFSSWKCMDFNMLLKNTTPKTQSLGKLKRPA